MSQLEFHLQHQGDAATALAILSKATQLSSSELKSAISKGALWLEKGKSVQRLRRVKKLINHGETLHFYYNHTVLAQDPPNATLVDDQESYSVWYKPSGMLSQGSKWSDHCTVTRWAQLHLSGDRQCYLVHRLDRATSGLIVVAHSKKAAQALTQLFEKRQLTKQYQAIAALPLLTNADKFTVEAPIDGKHAISHFSQLAIDMERKIGLYLINIETGRKHQIRKHAAYAGCPIVGDRLHGNQEVNEHFGADLQLCAVRLKFNCPFTGEPRDYHLPKDMQLSLNNLN
ncbi:RluA family pseudouridine synthase [Thalassotalea montiporae]